MLFVKSLLETHAQDQKKHVESQEKELSDAGLSSEVLDKVKGMVRTAVLEHWVLDSESNVKADVIAGIKQSVKNSTASSLHEMVERQVREAVASAVNSKAPSKVII